MERKRCGWFEDIRSYFFDPREFTWQQKNRFYDHLEHCAECRYRIEKYL
jgi:hypothetical protein